MKIALVSFNPIWENKLHNINLFEKFVDKASQNEAEYVVFPEMTLTGFSMNSKGLSEPIEVSKTVKDYQRIAKDYNINIIAGVILEKNKKYFNCCVAIDRNGDIGEIYEKIHPFSYSNEDEFYSSGNKIKSINFEGGWGISICYDLRFPELYQALSIKNKIIINIASWPENREDHWQSLLKARAIENQVYMIGVNRSGIDGNKLKYAGESSIYNPKGERILYEYKDGELDIYNIDLNEVDTYRTVFPMKKDRKVDLYSSWLKK